MIGPPPVEPPRDAPPRGSTAASSLLLVHTGDGKGKSTAAFGTALRAVAAGWPVCVVQFVKADRWRVGERETLVASGVGWWTTGDGFTWDADDLRRSEALAREGWAFAARSIAGGTHRLFVLDEITYPMNWGWIPADEVIAVLGARPRDVSVIATGRDAPEELIEIADTVTEMRNVKHAYDRGIGAMRGIDF